jgi:eukaryotic translation initiation factor 2C
MPVVNVGNRENPNYLPAEVCVVLPGQTIKRRLSPDQTAEMIRFACRKPWENGNSIVGDGKAVLGLNPNQNAVLVSTVFPDLELMLIQSRRVLVSRLERA